MNENLRSRHNEIRNYCGTIDTSKTKLDIFPSALYGEPNILRHKMSIAAKSNIIFDLILYALLSR